MAEPEPKPRYFDPKCSAVATSWHILPLCSKWDFWFRLGIGTFIFIVNDLFIFYLSVLSVIHGQGPALTNCSLLSLSISSFLSSLA